MKQDLTIDNLIEKHFSRVRLSTIKNVFSKEVDRIRIRDDETINWLSSNLHGIYKIKYTPAEINSLFYNLEVDSVELQQDIYRVKGFNKNWLVSSNSFNVLLIIAFHIVIKESRRDTKTMFNIYFVLYFKMIAGRYGHYFNRKNSSSDTSTAKLVYERMHQGYDLKRLGSQYAVIEYRFKFYAEDTNNFKKIENLNGDSSVSVLNYMFSSINSYVKKALSDTVDAEEVSRTELKTLNNENMELGSSLSRPSKYTDNIKAMMGTRKVLVDRMALQFVSKLFKNVTDSQILDTLDILESRHIRGDTLVTDTIKVSVSRIIKDGINPPFNKNLLVITMNLKSLWSSSRIMDKELLDIKDRFKKIIHNDVGYKRTATVSKIFVATAVYITVLAIIKTDVKG